MVEVRCVRANKQSVGWMDGITYGRLYLCAVTGEVHGVAESCMYRAWYMSMSHVRTFCMDVLANGLHIRLGNNFLLPLLLLCVCVSLSAKSSEFTYRISCLSLTLSLDLTLFLFPLHLRLDRDQLQKWGLVAVF